MRRIAVYVIYDKDGILDGYRKYYLRELRSVADTIVCVVNGALTPDSRLELEDIADDFFARENTGLLTYGWIEGLKHIGWDELYKYDELLMLNDSFFGPFYPLADMFGKMENSDADFWGALKNFEDKTITNFFGRKLRHGHMRGTIAYFYVIRNRLLHSAEFKNYWSSTPKIISLADTNMFNEIDFYDYIIDAGFKVDSYQSNALEGVLFDNLSHNMRRLIKDDKVPFARIRPFATEMKDQSCQISYGKDPRMTLDFIGRRTSYDVNFIWDYILRTKYLTEIWNQLQLEYVVPEKVVERPYVYSGSIAVILHIYYEDAIDALAGYCANFPANTDFYVTVVNDKTKLLVDTALKKRKLNFVLKTRPNVGVAMSTLWITYADVVTSGKYEYICYFHDKKSSYFAYSIVGEEFAGRCYENLFGTPEIVRNIINLFEDNSRLGVLGPPMVYHGEYFLSAARGWSGNWENLKKLLKMLNINVPCRVEQMTVSAFGDMFWFRSVALKKVIGYGFTYDDFDVKYENDGTILHAIERVYGLAAQDSGYYYADVINTDNARTDLINYQWVIQKLCENLTVLDIYPYSAIATVQQIRDVAANRKIIRRKARIFLQKLIASPRYHKFGMFLWKTYRKIFPKRGKTGGSE
jgi:rhamnosyltransferase